MSKLLPGNIIYGGPITSNEAQSHKSLGHYVVDRFKFHGERVILVDASTGQEYSARQMYELIVRLARAMARLGLKRGDVVGLCAENSVEFSTILFASFLVGATVAPMNITYLEREMDHAINMTKPKIMFASQQTIDKVIAVAKKYSFIEVIVGFGDQQPAANVQSLNKLIELERSNSLDFVPSEANKNEDVALILFSSGTTGLPKGVQITESNLLVVLDTQLKPNVASTTNMAVLLVLPWFHIFGCLYLIISGIRGHKLVFYAKFELNRFLEAIEKYRIVVAMVVPPIMVRLAKTPLVNQYDLSSLAVLQSSAASLSKDLIEQIKQRFGIKMVRQAYAMTETAGVLAQTDTHCKPGSVGGVKIGTYAKVVDPATGKNLGAYERGELCFKSGSIMKGYIGDAKSTQTIIQDGWLHTGDIGYFDDDFEFFIVDRIKELIKYKGFQVPPAELEALLLTHPKVKDAAVIGKPDEAAGELPLAFIVKQANVQLTASDVEQFVAERVSPAKKLRGGVIFIDEIPKNLSGKILRRVLRQMLKERTSKL